MALVDPVVVGVLPPTTRLEPSDTTSRALHREIQKEEEESRERSQQGEMAKPAMSSTLKKSMMLVVMLLLFASRKSIGGEVVVKMGCSGKLGDCLWKKGEEMEMEMEMDSETNRRVLWAAHKKYISYEALKRDLVPCSKPGVPYYNCRSLPKASPYSRGCEAISECRGG